MSRLNRVDNEELLNAEGGRAQKVSPEFQLRRSIMACLLWENSFYESGESIEKRIEDLCKLVHPNIIKIFALEAREKMHLRHVPLLLTLELLKKENSKASELIPLVVKRADEMAELLAMYWRNGKRPLAAQLKKGLARAFTNFSAYSLAKYNGDNVVKLRDVAFMVHPKPLDSEQAKVWAKLVNKSYFPEEIKQYLNLGDFEKLESPDTWEVSLSSGADKKATWERLMNEGKLGGIALLRNLRNMEQASVSLDLIKEYAARVDVSMILPFRFLTAGRVVPKMESVVEGMFLRAVEDKPKLSGKTILIVDVSGSMYNGSLSSYSEVDRAGVACSLATLARELCQDVAIYATAGNDFTRVHETALVPARRGFALSDGIYKMKYPLGGGGIFLKQVIDFVREKEGSADRIIVITDEQDCATAHDDQATKAVPFGKYNYIINVSVEKNGVGYGNKWHHIDGFSDAVLDYIREYEEFLAAKADFENASAAVEMGG